MQPVTSTDLNFKASDFAVLKEGKFTEFYLLGEQLGSGMIQPIKLDRRLR